MNHEKSLAKKRLTLFILIAFAAAWAIFLLGPLWGIAYGSGLSLLLLAAAMFTPSLANIATRLITKEGFQQFYLRPRFKGQIKAYLLLYFGPTALLFFSGLLYFLIFPHQFDPAFGALQALTAAGSTSTGLSVSTLLLISALQVILIGPVINIIPTLGEELGWRGYLLPKLRLFLSDRGALLLTGVIWGLWHLPVIVMGHNYGTAYFGYPYLGILTMVVFCMSLGVIEGYAFLKMKSVIPAAMIHSLINAGAAFPLYFIKDTYNPLLGPAVTGLIGGLPFMLCAALLLYKTGQQNMTPALTENQEGEAAAAD